MSAAGAGASRRILPSLEGIAYGSDYNPEQWPESTWAEDVRLMAEAGVNLVTVGVFSWAKLQPAPGELTAGWLDRVLDLLAGAGILVDLATATASPPAWLVAAHPEILPVTADGTRLAFGARQSYCPSAPAHRAAAADLAGRSGARITQAGTRSSRRGPPRPSVTRPSSSTSPASARTSCWPATPPSGRCSPPAARASR